MMAMGELQRPSGLGAKLHSPRDVDTTARQIRRRIYEHINTRLGQELDQHRELHLSAVHITISDSRSGNDRAPLDPRTPPVTWPDRR